MATSTIKAPLRNVFSISTTPTTFNVSASYRGLMVISGPSDNRCGMYILYSLTGGAVTAVTVKAASDITINTATTGKLIVSTSTGNALVAFESYQGTIG